MIYLLQVEDLLSIVFVSVLVEWEVVDLEKEPASRARRRRRVIISKVSTRSPRVKPGIWVRSLRDRVVCWVPAVSNHFFPEGFIRRIKVKVFHRAYTINMDPCDGLEAIFKGFPH
jgi:hypothetical protein